MASPRHGRSFGLLCWLFFGLTSDDLGKAAESIALSRKTVQIIKQSLFMSVAINGAALVLASTGEIGPVVGAIIHNIGSIVVVGNSSRLIGYRFRHDRST